MAGDIGLTESQQSTLSDLESRENGTHPKGLKLTDKMIVELSSLRFKRDNPELPEGAKTYCKQWLKQTLYGRYTEIKSKYISKGHYTEEEGFTILCLQLGLGMARKNTERKDNGWLTGECDLIKNGIVYDNKSSWSLDTFPMFEAENPNKDYEYQMQGYMELYDCEKAILGYTLSDCDEITLGKQWPYMADQNEKQRITSNLVYTKKEFERIKSAYFSNAQAWEFIEIHEKDRIKAFEFKRDRDFISRLKKRVDLCQKYIDKILSE